MVSVNPGVDVGDMLYWNGSAWVVLSPGITGQMLLTQGIGAAPIWGQISMLEGNYEGWAFQWYKIIEDPVETSDLPGDFKDPINIDWFVDDENNVIHVVWQDLIGYDRFGIFSCSDFSNVVITPAVINGIHVPSHNGYNEKTYGWKFGSAANWQCISRSMQRYVFVPTTGSARDYETFDIYNGSTRVWLHSIWGDLPSPQNTDSRIEGFEISTTGKYILLYCYYFDSPNRYLNFILYKGLSTILDPGTSSGVTETVITDTAKAWTVDEWANKWVKVSTGTGMGYTAQITTNTATTLTCSAALFVTNGMVSSDEYKILDY